MWEDNTHVFIASCYSTRGETEYYMHDACDEDGDDGGENDDRRKSLHIRYDLECIMNIHISVFFNVINSRNY